MRYTEGKTKKHLYHFRLLSQTCQQIPRCFECCRDHSNLVEPDSSATHRLGQLHRYTFKKRSECPFFWLAYCWIFPPLMCVSNQTRISDNPPSNWHILFNLASLCFRMMRITNNSREFRYHLYTWLITKFILTCFTRERNMYNESKTVPCNQNQAMKQLRVGVA